MSGTRMSGTSMSGTGALNQFACSSAVAAFPADRMRSVSQDRPEVKIAHNHQQNCFRSSATGQGSSRSPATFTAPLSEGLQTQSARRPASAMRYFDASARPLRPLAGSCSALSKTIPSGLMRAFQREPALKSKELSSGPAGTERVGTIPPLQLESVFAKL